MTKANVLGAALLAAACSMTGCGDDTAADDHTGHAPDEKIPCPPETPEFVATPSEGLEATGEDGLITAKLIDADWSPPRLYQNDWTVLFLNADGEPVEDIELTKVEPYMPVHRHGTSPVRLTPGDEPGVMQVERVNLRMGGPWEVRFTVTSESTGSDYIVFHVCVDE